MFLIVSQDLLSFIIIEPNWLVWDRKNIHVFIQNLELYDKIIQDIDARFPAQQIDFT